MWNRNEQTICAISTPQGTGGIAVIRVSGKDALLFSKKISKTLKNQKNIESHRAYFSTLVDFENNKVDEAVITYFAENKSFTGESTVEISCHGSTFIAQQILDLLVLAGCRMADRGEFTYRAFMNGRIDLVQAESVLSLIESQNKASAKVALRQLDGEVSKKFEYLISELTWCLAHIEASIDFIEQGVEVVDSKVLISKLIDINRALGKLINSYQSGRLIKDGVRLALVGEPNAGKSSLLNLLLQSDRAIVTPFAGTTRDVVEGEALYKGIKFNISDTAGLRETDDLIEIIGIDKSKSEAEKADIMCFVLDCTQDDWLRALRLAQQLKNNKKIFLLNKRDDISDGRASELFAKISETLGLESKNSLIFSSTHQPECRNDIFELVIKNLGSLEYLDEALVSSTRQFEQAQYAFEMISNSISELENNIGAEFTAMHLKESLISLQKILGQAYDDQIMDRVFKEFCLGK